jgi:hypothetical protein
MYYTFTHDLFLEILISLYGIVANVVVQVPPIE